MVEYPQMVNAGIKNKVDRSTLLVILLAAAALLFGLALRGLVRLAAEPLSPDESPRARFEPMLAAATTPDERKLILGAIAKSGRSELLPLLKPLLRDDAVRAEAEAARAALGRPLPGMKPLYWRTLPPSTMRAAIGAIFSCGASTPILTFILAKRWTCLMSQGGVT